MKQFNTEIQKLGENLPLAASNNVDRYILLAQSKKVREIEDLELLDFCKSILLTAFISSGSKIPEIIDFRFLIGDLNQDLKNYYSSQSVEDICEAFRQGSKGLLKETYGINSKSWNCWLKEYFANQDRLFALKSKSNPKVKQPEPTEAEKAKIEQTFFDTVLIPLYEKHKKGVDIIDHYAIPLTYNIFVKNGWINKNFDADLVEYATEILSERQKMVMVKLERLKPDSKEFELELLRLCKGLRVKLAFNNMYKKKFDLQNYGIPKIH